MGIKYLILAFVPLFLLKHTTVGWSTLCQRAVCPPKVLEREDMFGAQDKGKDRLLTIHW